MVSSILKFEDLFPFLKFGHFFCPFLNSPKKSLKKKRYKTINRKRDLKNRVKKGTLLNYILAYFALSFRCFMRHALVSDIMRIFLI